MTNDQASGALLTPDKRYIVVRGRLWRATNPNLTATERAGWVEALMEARRKVHAAMRSGEATSLSKAHRAVDAAKQGLGERGPVWWADGGKDYNRYLVKNTPYAAWFDALQRA